MSMDEDIKFGLAGVTVDYTAVSKVMPETNSLTYRGYAAQDLAHNRRFEDVAYLIWHGHLPTPAERDALAAEERAARPISDGLMSVIRSFDAGSHPMDTLRTAVSYLGQEDPETSDDTPEANLRKAIRMYAKIPTIIAADNRIRKGLDPIDPDPDLGFSENIFHLFFGSVPHPDVVKCFDISMTLYAEHSFNASTFTARVITSSLSDIYSAVTGAIGSLKGPLHGGANEAVMHMMLDIDDPAKAQDWMLDAIRNKKKIMGFGHRVYKNGDSRVPTMTQAYHKIATLKDGAKWVEMSKSLETTMIQEKGIYPNLDFPAGPAYYLMGFDIPTFTPLFVASRITGWTAHILEQKADNKLIRPLSAYNGSAQREVPSD